MNQSQRQQAARFGVEVVEMRQWNPGRVFEFNDPVYLPLDLDVLDPAFAPGFHTMNRVVCLRVRFWESSKI